MAITASISGTQSIVQSGLQQLKLQQARRNAEQAEQTAQALQVQADEAQRRAAREQENARSLSVQADQAQTNAGRARQGLASIQTASDSVAQLGNVVDQVITKQQAAPAATSSVQESKPVVNTQGEVTGTLINTTA
ncbi:MAG: hypothetical protein EG825_12045 [Rhodocyclaceae bacterium]|nr:hypothetical protein [Rhodocyclaceae bacterium]